MKFSTRAAAGGDLEHGADQDADHVAHEGVGGDAEGSGCRRRPSSSAREDVALEADVVGLGRGEGGEVVGARQGARRRRRGRRGRCGAATRGRGRARTGWTRGGRAPGRGRCASVASRRASKPSSPGGAPRSRRCRRAPTPLSRRARSVGTSAWVSKLATCPSAWTPASVRPATVSSTGSRNTVSSAVSSSPCTVRSPGCLAQPRNPDPSYSMSSLTVDTRAVCSGWQCPRRPPSVLESLRCASC